MTCGKIDKYDYLIAMAALDAGNCDVKMFEALDDSNVVLSKRITDKIDKLINSHKKNQVKILTKTQRVLSRVAIIALVTITVAFAAMMSISAVRTAVWKAIVEWYDTYINVSYKPETPVSEQPTEIKEIRKPTLLPQGAEEEAITNNKIKYLSEYYVGDDCVLVFLQHIVEGFDFDIDNETVTIEEITVNGYAGNLLKYDKNDIIAILWIDNEYAYKIIGYCYDVKTIIAIAESVK